MDSPMIDLEMIQVYRPISTNIPTERLDNFILEAQLHDLRTVLGNALYYDFITKYKVTHDPMHDAYQDLYNGSVWTYGGYTKQHYGLKPIVAYYTLARITQNNNINLTSYGVTRKLNAQSEPVDQVLIKQQVNELRSIAISFQEQTIEFLQNNIDTYPLYGNSKEPLNKTSIKFFHI